MQADNDSQIENATIPNFYVTVNVSEPNDSNSTFAGEDFDDTVTYLIVSVIFISFCIISAIINARILICTKWIRRPLSPTLFISVSLALADAYLSVMLGLGFLVNSLLPRGLHFQPVNACFMITLEAFRLSAVLISTIHLLVLAGNHYLGILCPFLSRRWLTHKNLLGVIILIWVSPTLYIFLYFSLLDGEGYQTPDCMAPATWSFLKLQHFRVIYSGLFFIPLILMFIIYFHISIIVRRHQTGRIIIYKRDKTMSRRHDPRNNPRNDQDQQFERNLKAIWTSMLILSTYVICFMPAVILYIILCDDCYHKFDNVDKKVALLVGTISNFLLISKPLINPLIYASRMNEIRAAMRRMNAECRGFLCLFVSSDELDRTYNSSGLFYPPAGGRTCGGSRISRVNQCSLNSVQLNNGYGGYSRSLRRKGEDVTTDL